MKTHSVLNGSFLIFVWVLLALLAMVQPVSAETGPGDDQTRFYPLPPNTPRLQFLASFSSANDLSAKKSGFRDFVFGGAVEDGHLATKPYGLDIVDGAIFVVDTRGGGWAVFDVAKGETQFVRPAGAGILKKPINISIDSDGKRYVTDTDRQQVLVFDRNDRFVKAYGEPGQFKPIDVAISGEKLYITDAMHHQVHVLDKSSGEFLDSFGSPGSKPGEMFHPTNLEVASDGTIYVVDTTNFRVQQFSADGQFIRSMGKNGNTPGNFLRPKGIALDREGLIYVVDSAFENVQILSPKDGGALMHFGAPGSDPDSINMPTVVKIDYDSVRYFEKYVDPSFKVEYLVAVASQFGGNKVVVFGFGSPIE